MPEAAVYEDRYPSLLQHEIRNTLDIQSMHSPALDSCADQSHAKTALR